MKKTFLIIIGFIISIFIINVMSGETDYTQSSNKNYKSNIENKHSCEKVASFYLDPEVILMIVEILLILSPNKINLRLKNLSGKFTL